MNRKRIGIALLLCLGILAAGCGISADGKGTEAVPPSGSAERKPAAAQDQKAPLGTRQNPVPAGTEVKVGKEWQVTLLEINPDAWEVLKAENMFNTPPEEGMQYVMVRLRVSYVGEESGTPWLDLRMKYLGGDGNTYSEGCGVLPDPLLDIGEQFPGASAEGYECWVVPGDAVKGGAIIVEQTFSFDDTRVFFAGVR